MASAWLAIASTAIALIDDRRREPLPSRRGADEIEEDEDGEGKSTDDGGDDDEEDDESEEDAEEVEEGESDDDDADDDADAADDDEEALTQCAREHVWHFVLSSRSWELLVRVSTNSCPKARTGRNPLIWGSGMNEVE